MGYSVSVDTIHHDHYTTCQWCDSRKHSQKGKIGIFPKRPTAANIDVVRKILNMFKLVNMPTQREIALMCAVSLGTINRSISK